MRGSTRQDDIPAGERLGYHRLLREQGQSPRNAGAPNCAAGASIEANDPSLGLKQSGGEAKEGRFAGAVRTEQTDEAACRQCQRHVSDGEPAAVAKSVGDGIDRKNGSAAHQNAIRFWRRNNTRKKGAPTAAVITPTGISLGPGAARAPESAAIRKAAPRGAAIGSSRR